MSTAATAVPAQTDMIDTAALRLMLSYVEAECRRLGAMDAARHAALAAALVAGAGPEARRKRRTSVAMN